MSASASDASPPRVTPALIVARSTSSLIGGYVFVWGFIAAGIPVLLASGMSFDDARNLTHLLAFLVYVTAACWAFVCASLWKVVVALFGGGTAMTALAWLLTRSTT